MIKLTKTQELELNEEIKKAQNLSRNERRKLNKKYKQKH